ncbi:MAG: hypothetical protein ACLU30_00080 [Odoribacter splanchnicus]
MENAGSTSFTRRIGVISPGQTGPEWIWWLVRVGIADRDRVTVVGTEDSVKSVEKILGNSLRRLGTQSGTYFLGIALGILLGSIPLLFREFRNR